MEDEYCVTLETDEEGCGHLSFELPPDTPEEQIAYFKTLLLRVELGSIELLDPDTREVVYFLRPLILH